MRTTSDTALIAAILIAIKTFTAASTAAAQCGPSALPDAQDWELQLQCRSSLDPGIAPFNLPYPSSLSSQYVSLGENGDVAIRYFSSGAFTEGVFYGVNGSGSTVITANNTSDPVYSTDLDLHAGMIALTDAVFAGGGAHVYSSAGVIIQNFPAGGPQSLSNPSGPTMLADGALAYRADFGSDDVIAFDEFDGLTRIQTVRASTISPDYSFLFNPDANDSRQIVANTIPGSGPTRRIIRFEADGTPTTVAETGAQFNSFVNSTAIASDGTVAFSARQTSDSVWGVYRWKDGVLTEIATGADPDINNSSLANFPPVVNSMGWVAFRATDVANNSTALWVGDGDTLVKLVEYDQPLPTDLGDLPAGFDFGSGTGKQVMNGVVDINDNGQVALAAFLRNGTIGVYVATPLIIVGCNPADLAEPIGQIDFSDVVAFLQFFAAQNTCADLAEPYGQYDFSDVIAFLTAFTNGCP
ncbi:MAG: GC-type dockerin domain-anchored protein [Phycisphaerales bacterium]